MPPDDEHSGEQEPDPKRSDAPHHDHLQDHLQQFETQLKQANEELNRRSGRPLILAIVTGLAIGAVVMTGVFIKPVMILLAVAATVAGSSELANALRLIGRRVPRIPVIVVAVVGPPAGYWLGPVGLGLAVLAGVVFVLAWRLAEQASPAYRVPPGALLRDFAAGALVVLYVTFLASWTMVLHGEEDGQWWLLGSLICIVATDTGAWAVGRSFGKHKMAPTISPGKSWEGFAGAVAAALVAGVLVGIFMWQQPWWVGLIAGAVFLGTATMGDLAESMIKRDIGIKDMSSWMPGHGGVLDRLDSIAPTAPLAFLVYVVFH